MRSLSSGAEHTLGIMMKIHHPLIFIYFSPSYSSKYYSPLIFISLGVAIKCKKKKFAKNRLPSNGIPALCECNILLIVMQSRVPPDHGKL
jgi:hypothetical protein